MSFSADDRPRPPYSFFLEFGWFRKSVGVAVAAAAVIAFGFVSVSIRLSGGGAGWPLHDVLHPLLGLLLGPGYGALSAVLGTAVSEVASPYTALDGMSPVMGGLAALTTGLLVRGDRWWLCISGLVAGSVGMVLAVDTLVFGRALLDHAPGAAVILFASSLGAVPHVRQWCSQFLAPSDWSWRTAVALYAICFVGSAIGILPLWLCEVTGSPLSAGGLMGPPLLLVAERVCLPLIGAVLGMVLWPALRRRVFSVANQLRYGLPLFILATFFFAGRLFIERAYEATRAETTEQLRDQSQAVARTLTTELERAETLLYARVRREPSRDPDVLFEWVERISNDAQTPTKLPDETGSILERVRSTVEPQWAFVRLSDTTSYGIAIGLPLTRENTPAERAEELESVAVACIGPSTIEKLLSISESSTSDVYLVNRDRQAVFDVSHGPAQSLRDPEPLVSALQSSAGSTAEVSRGRYHNDVVGSIAPMPGLSGSVVVEQAQEDAYFHVFEMLLTMALIVLLAGGGAVAVGFYVSRRVVAPLDKLIEAARQVGEGNLSTRVDVRQDNELGELADTFNRMTQDLSDSIDRLRENEERLRIALDAAQMGTWNWTVDPENITWSPQTYSLLRVPHRRDENLLEAFLARVHPDDRDYVKQQIQRVYGNETRFTIEHRIRPRYDEVRWVRLRGRVFRMDGRPKRMSGVIMDITARKEAEQELRAAKEKAEEMSRLKTAFLANVSHEIRTPLTSIIGFAEVLEEEVPEHQQDGAKKIVESGRRLMQTLDSVLDLSMIEAGEFNLECRWFNLPREVRQRVNLLRPMACRKGLDLNVDVECGDTEVYLDPGCLDRILTNLITNAVKFTEAGRVDVRVRTRSSYVVLTVSDTGIGIAEDFLPNLFEAFKQESGGLQREHGGTGLGLSITKELVELMEGAIEVNSQKGEGTTFTVVLPYEVSGVAEGVVESDQENTLTY